MRSLHLRFVRKRFFFCCFWKFLFRILSGGVNLDWSWRVCGGPLLSSATTWYIRRWTLLHGRERNLWRKLRSFAQNTTINRENECCRRCRRCRRHHHHLPGPSFHICGRTPGSIQLARVSMMIQRRHFWRYEPYVPNIRAQREKSNYVFDDKHTKSGNWKIDKTRRSRRQ